MDHPSHLAPRGMTKVYPGISGFPLVCWSVSWKLPETGATEFLAKILAIHLDNSTHFVQAGAHSLTDAIAKGFFAAGAPRRRK